MTDRYFVYEHTRIDTGDVFYVGKGKWTPLKRYIRASTPSKRNIHWQRIVAKAGGFDHRIVAEFEHECDALAEEVRRISMYGRRNLGGVLSNITAGGEGQSGVVMSESAKQKISLANRGKPKPESVRKAVSSAQRGVPNPPEQNAAHSARMTGSGNPNFGKKNSPETLRKKSESMLGKLSGERHPFYGKKRPQHVIDVLREKQSKKVVDKSTGKVFSSIKDAAAFVGKSSGTVWRWLSGHRKNPTSLEFA